MTAVGSGSMTKSEREEATRAAKIVAKLIDQPFRYFQRVQTLNWGIVWYAFEACSPNRDDRSGEPVYADHTRLAFIPFTAGLDDLIAAQGTDGWEHAVVVGEIYTPQRYELRK